MIHPAFRDGSKGVAGQHLHDDNGDPIGPRQFCVEHGLGASDDGLTHALTILTPDEIAETLTNRVVIEQATGMLMFVYRIDADAAHELLRWRAQAANATIHRLAAQLSSDLVRCARNDWAEVRATCDQLFLPSAPNS